ncbi:MAG: hypothetical protein NTV81_01960 [Candidatus Komeilibacteria bacterium]|nr:hypothetical protein [Candidatus Komeilibacteria bacterium]
MANSLPAIQPGDNATVRFLLTHNSQQSHEFCSPGSKSWRRQWRTKHPTQIGAFKCMDGRLNFGPITDTPAGMIQPFRNIGGHFDLGWPHCGEVVDGWIQYAIQNRGVDCLVLATYHYSKGELHRGCRGCGYDWDFALEQAVTLRDQVARIFDPAYRVVYPLVVGVETDEDCLIWHGHDPSQWLDLTNQSAEDEHGLKDQLQSLYPNMSRRIINDLLPLVVGNIGHVADVRSSHRAIADATHRESVLALGRGFDWLHLLNKVLIVGPYSPNLSEPIVTAASILWENWQEGRVNQEDGLALMSSAVFREEGSARIRAQEKAAVMARIAQQAIRDKLPELSKILQWVVGVTDLNTRYFHRLEVNL